MPRYLVFDSENGALVSTRAFITRKALSEKRDIQTDVRRYAPVEICNGNYSLLGLPGGWLVDEEAIQSSHLIISTTDQKTISKLFAEIKAYLESLELEICLNDCVQYYQDEDRLQCLRLNLDFFGTFSKEQRSEIFKKFQDNGFSLGHVTLKDYPDPNQKARKKPQCLPLKSESVLSLLDGGASGSQDPFISPARNKRHHHQPRHHKYKNGTNKRELSTPLSVSPVFEPLTEAEIAILETAIINGIQKEGAEVVEGKISEKTVIALLQKSNVFPRIRIRSAQQDSKKPDELILLAICEGNMDFMELVFNEIKRRNTFSVDFPRKTLKDYLLDFMPFAIRYALEEDKTEIAIAILNNFLLYQVEFKNTRNWPKVLFEEPSLEFVNVFPLAAHYGQKDFVEAYILFLKTLYGLTINKLYKLMAHNKDNRKAVDEALASVDEGVFEHLACRRAALQIIQDKFYCRIYICKVLHTWLAEDDSEELTFYRQLSEDYTRVNASYRNDDIQAYVQLVKDQILFYIMHFQGKVPLEPTHIAELKEFIDAGPTNLPVERLRVMLGICKRLSTLFISQMDTQTKMHIFCYAVWKEAVIFLQWFLREVAFRALKAFPIFQIDSIIYFNLGDRIVCTMDYVLHCAPHNKNLWTLLMHYGVTYEPQLFINWLNSEAPYPRLHLLVAQGREEFLGEVIKKIAKIPFSPSFLPTHKPILLNKTITLKMIGPDQKPVAQELNFLEFALLDGRKIAAEEENKENGPLLRLFDQQTLNERLDMVITLIISLDAVNVMPPNEIRAAIKNSGFSDEEKETLGLLVSNGPDERMSSYVEPPSCSPLSPRVIGEHVPKAIESAPAQNSAHLTVSTEFRQ